MTIVKPDYYDHPWPGGHLLPLVPFQISCIEERAATGQDILDRHMVMVRLVAVRERPALEDIAHRVLSVVDTHAALRCSIDEADGRLVQSVRTTPHPDQVARRLVIDCGTCELAHVREAVATIAADDPFPIRVAVGVCDGRPVIGVGVHHYFCDESSLDLVVDAVAMGTVWPDAADYLEYCGTLRARLARDGVGARTHSFWNRQLADICAGHADVSRVEQNDPSPRGAHYDAIRSDLGRGFAADLGRYCERTGVAPTLLLAAAVSSALRQRLRRADEFVPILVLRDPHASAGTVGALINNCVVPLPELVEFDLSEPHDVRVARLRSAGGKLLQTMRHCMLPLEFVCASTEVARGTVALEDTVVVNAIIDLPTGPDDPSEASVEQVEFFTDRGVDFPFVELTFDISGGGSIVMMSYSPNRYRRDLMQTLVAQVASCAVTSVTG